MSFKRLIWGVKASFRSYVEAAGGSVTLSDGATRTENGGFVFNAVPGGNLNIASDGSATGAMRFEGTVTFEAHGGMLKSTITGLGLEAGVDGLVLTVPETAESRCAIAKLGPVEFGSEDTVTIGAEITLDGMYHIADNYPPGTELDSLQLD